MSLDSDIEVVSCKVLWETMAKVLEREGSLADRVSD